MAASETSAKKMRRGTRSKMVFYANLAAYLSANVLLFSFWLFSGASNSPWFILPLICWEIGVAAHYESVFHPEYHLKSTPENPISTNKQWLPKISPEILIALPRALMVGLVSWCVAIVPNGNEETPLTCRIAVPHRVQRESVGNGAETKRPIGYGYDALVTQSSPIWKRWNGRPASGKGKRSPMKNLPEGAGSPISRMPQTTESGLQPTHHAHIKQ